MKDSVRIKERNIWYTTKFSFHKPDGVFIFHDGFKSAALTLKPVWVSAALLNQSINEGLRPDKRTEYLVYHKIFVSYARRSLCFS